MSSRFSQGYISPRRRVALIENGSLSHASPTYLATSPHYHANGSPRTGPPIDIMDDFIEYVDPVLQPRPLPVIPPQILSAYHHGRFKICLINMYIITTIKPFHYEPTEQLIYL